LAGNKKLMESEGIAFTEADGAGTKIYVAVNGEFAGAIVISDEVKPDAAAAVAALKKVRGVKKIVMLTGDNFAAASETAARVGINEVYADLLPHQKVEAVERLNAGKRPKGKLAFVGDGLNDAPVLARADIGIAMGGLGSDAAIEAADVVLMTDEPSKLITALGTAKFTKRIVWQNIIFALGVKAAFLLLGALGIFTMWEAVFADVGVSVLAILNAMRALKHK
jgi:Cd2+/Zn2+-exporting ATPase